MASISLPRVLQQRKSSLEIERENFEKFQNQSITKAINVTETPVKEKHVRSTIIGTFHDKGAITFWVVALRLPLQEHRIVAWKFCHVLHKVLREGHSNCLQNSERHTGMIKDLGKLWVHLRESYGKLIQLYCTLLITKIKFHARNPRFPGNLQVTGEELEDIGENDINNYFQMSVEMFDYMDDLLMLQAAIFDSIDNSGANSMTTSGQCRMAPLVPCIQDSNQLYDFSVKLLFKLHAMLPADTLSGHRERFFKQFKLLKKFYHTTNNLQYFKNLISIPTLPENPPNFLIQSELRTYVPPVVILPPEEPSEDQDLIGSLVDMSDTSSQMTSPDNGQDSVDNASSQYADLLIERDRLIEHLQSEVSRLRNEVHSLVVDHRSTVALHREKIASLENLLTSTKAELENEKAAYSVLLEQQSIQKNTPQLEEKIGAAEDRAKAFEDKFQKLKSAYTQMREEHINLIRQKAECDKQLTSLKKTITDTDTKREALQTTINELMREKQLIIETNVKSSDDVKAEVDIVKEELNMISKKYQQEKAEHSEALNIMQQSLGKLESECSKIQKEKENVSSKLVWCNNEKSILECELQDLLQQKQSIEDHQASLTTKMELTEQALCQEKLNVSLSRLSIMEYGVKAASVIIKWTIHELDNPAISSIQCGLEYFRSLFPASEDALKCMEKALIKYENDKSPTEEVATEIVRATHMMSNIIIQGVATSNTSKDIVFGEKMAQECRILANSVSTCIEYADSITKLASISNESSNGNLSNGGDRKMAEEHILEIRKLLESVLSLSGKVSGQEESGSGDSVEGELANMDKAIEEAAARIEEMLKLSRAADSGLKLEVNEKILDACTSLMAAIRELVKKSRSLQAEIVALGRGTNTAKEFYKRNHQWTEGLISAAKAVALGAKLLLTAADKVVTNGGKLEHVMVASQEIAASTAQLVVASRVRAARGSEKLQALTVASRAVSTATGAVIATAKTCAQLVEESDDLDMSGMSSTAGRRMEMESRVRVLELEQALATERLKVAALRRTNYRLTDSEMNEAESKSTNGNK